MDMGQSQLAQSNDLSQIADYTNQNNVGVSQRKRNELMRSGLIDPSQYNQTQSTAGIKEATQPTSVPTLSSLYNTPQPIDTWSTIQKQPLVGLYRYSDSEINKYGSIDAAKQHTIDSTYNDAVSLAKRYSNAGFYPKNNVGDWKWSDKYISGKSLGQTIPNGGGVWSKGNDFYNTIVYDPSKGYSQTHKANGKLIDPESFSLVLAAASPVLMGAGGLTNGLASGAGEAGGASGGTGLTATGGVGSIAEGSLGSGISGGLSSAGSGVSSAGLGQGLTVGTASSTPSIGSYLSSLFAANNNGIFGTGVSTGSSMADSAAQNFIKSSIMSGGDLKNSLINTLANTSGNYVNGNVSSYLQPQLGETVSKMFGGAASGGIRSLFSNNNVTNGSLFGAMSGGLHGFLNSTDRSNNTFNEQSNITNRNTAQNITKLAKIFTNRK